MIDLFKIPRDFPGWAEASQQVAAERVRRLEQFTADVHDSRFSAYLQLHEFEALLLTDLSVLIEQHPNRRKEILDLADRLQQQFESPEHVNGQRPPSYWIKDAVLEYNKTLDGPITASRIGLSRLRERCPHFGQWLRHLEQLAWS